jgi:hypothetical protein
LVQFASRAREDVLFWTELAEGQLSGDTLVVQQNNEGQVEHLSGILGDVSAEQVKFNWDGQDIPVKRSKVLALAYFHGKQQELQSAICQVTTVEGARLPVVQIEWDGAENSFQVTALGGIKLKLPWHDLLQADYSSGKLVYLSDLEPVQSRWTPRITLPGSAESIQGFGLPRRDLSFSGSALTLQWPVAGAAGSRSTTSYAKGLAVRSRTEIEYRIPEGMQRLFAIAGIDPATAGQGNVSLKITADESVLWQGEIDGRAAPVEIDVALPEARRLRIVVDYGGNLDYGDRLHLVDARMTK